MRTRNGYATPPVRSTVNGRLDPGGPSRHWWSSVAILTLGMGVAVAVSWFAFFRSLTSYGPEPEAMVQPARLAVYATQFAIIVPFSYWLGRTRLRIAPSGTLARIALVAWLLEGVILTIIGAPLVANELDPDIAWYYWLAATAGPLQPAIAFAGSWLGARSGPGIR